MENDLNEITKETLTENFSHIIFEPEAHRYFSEKDGSEYTSVSAFIEAFKRNFNRKKISKKIASRKGISCEEVISLWNTRRDYSIVRGTEFHLYVEKYLCESRRIEFSTPLEHETKEFHQFWDLKNKKRYEIVATELIVANNEMKLAGTIDCLVRNKNNGRYYLWDWKTNQKLNDKNPYQKFKVPINHLPESNLHKYSLQLEIYKQLLEKTTSLKIEKGYLIHFQRTGPYKVLELFDTSKEVLEMFEKRKKQLALTNKNNQKI